MRHDVEEVEKRLGTFLDALAGVWSLTTAWRNEDGGEGSKSYHCFGNYSHCTGEPMYNELLSPFLICRVCQSLGKESSGWLDKFKELLRGRS